MKFWLWLTARSGSVFWLVVILSIAGGAQYLFIPVSFLPAIPVRQIDIVFPHHGDETGTLEELAVRILSEMRSLKDIQESAYTVDPLKLTIRLEFSVQIEPEVLVPEIRARLDHVDRIIQRLGSPVISAGYERKGYTFKLFIMGEVPFEDLSVAVRGDVLPRIRQLEGVSLVDVSGLLERRNVLFIHSWRADLWTDPFSIDRQLNPDSQQQPLGRVQAGQRLFPLVFQESGAALEQRNVMQSTGGHLVSPASLGFLGAEYIPVGHHTVNHKRAVALKVYTRDNSRLTDVRIELQRLMNDLRQRYPDMHLVVAEDRARTVEESVDGLWLSTGMAMAGVISILFLFTRGVRMPVLMGCMLPLSVCFAMGLMKLTDIALNIVSLSGLIVGTGILIDNGIVISEGIIRFHQKGCTVLKAICLGVQDMTPPLIASNLTTLIIFVPLLAGDGVLSLIFREEARVIILTIIASVVLSVLLLPLLYRVLFAVQAPETDSILFHQTLGVVRYGSKWIYTHPYPVVLVYLILTVAGAATFPKLPVQTVPEFGNEHWQADINSQEIVTPVSADLLTENAQGPDGYLLSPVRQGTRLELYGPGAEEASRRIGEKGGIIRPGDNPLIRLFDADQADIEVTFRAPRDQLTRFVPVLKRQTDTVMTTKQRMRSSVRTLLGPFQEPDSTTNPNRAILMRFSRSDQMIRRMNRRSVPGANIIQNYQSFSGQKIRGDLHGRIIRLAYSSEAFRKQGREHLKEARSHGVGIQTGGRIAQEKLMVNELSGLLLLSGVILYVVLVLQYGSFLWPLLVLSVLPPGITGSLLALHILGDSLNSMSGIGLVAMMGVIVNDAILKVSVIRKLAGSLPPEQILARSLELRLKPILLTTLTTVVACLPVFLVTGTGNLIQRPLVIALTGGLIMATLASLTLLPALALLFLRNTYSATDRWDIGIGK